MELLLAMQGRPAGQAWERTFAIAGVLGTIDYRMTGDDTVGRVYAKTGSLWNAIALSGVLYNRHDGVAEPGRGPARMAVDYPDRIAPSDGGVAEVLYVGGLGGTAAVSYEGDYRVVHLGFPVESIDGADQRTAFLTRILDFFGL